LNEPGTTRLSFAFAVLEDNPEAWGSQGTSARSVKRPPILKDYFDPKLRKLIAVIRRLRQVIVKFQVDEGYVPAM